MKLMSSEIDQLATALAAAQAKMEPAVFNKTNPHYRSKYADLASINNAADPALNENGLAFVSIPMMNSDGSFSLFSILLHKSGQWLASEYPIAVGSPQSMGSQITYARRYSKSGMTGVVAEEDDDANAAEAAATKQGVTQAVLGNETHSKEKSRPIYTRLEKEMFAIKDGRALFKWGAETKPLVNSMHP